MSTSTAAALETARSIVTGLMDPAILVDADLAPVFFNALYARMSGHRPRRLWRLLESGVSPFEIFGRPQEDERVQLRQAIDSGRAITLPEARVRAADGSEAVMMQSFIPVLDADAVCVGAISMFRDLSAEARVHSRYTELIAAEKARAEELERQVEDRTRQLTAALEEVTRLSRVDPLTQTYNRRAFTEYAGQALRLADRHERIVAVLMCDLDHFKRVNDTYGHQAGDTILQEVARALERVLRSTDKIGRFGGEEFVVLLSETQPENVAQVAERCRRAVRAIPVAELIPDMAGPQTVSIGAAVFPAHGESLDELLRCADEALYAAKRAGRDAAVVYEHGRDSGSERRDDVPRSESVEERARLLSVGEARAEIYAGGLSGVHAVAATSLAQGLELLRERRFDVVVAEERLPDGTGIEFLRKSLASAPGALRILALPSRDELMALRGIHSAHVDEFVLRGDGPTAVASAIEQGRLRRQLAREELLGGPDVYIGVNAGHLEAFGHVLADPSLSTRLEPLVDAASGEVAGHEVVVRAREPLIERRELLYTAAVRTGSLWELGRLVRRRVAEAIAELPGEGLIVVELHPGEVGDPELRDEDSPLRPHADRLVFAITERTSVPDARAFFNDLRSLRGVGFKLAIADLGAGSASLGAVASIAPDYVKIHRELVRGLHSSRPRRNLVRNLVDYCEGEGIASIADGVETEPDRQVARELGCKLLKGALIGPVTEL
jgi:diguanylate cyclase (GGDEF)-like protein